MLAKAKELGCPESNVACLCLNEKFGNGIRDCTNESCPPKADRQSVIDAGVQYCAREFIWFVLEAIMVG